MQPLFTTKFISSDKNNICTALFDKSAQHLLISFTFNLRANK